MKTRPIIFSAPMVRAILEGRKTQTRRVIKPQPVLWDEGSIDLWSTDRVGPTETRCVPDVWVEYGCPYGQPGDGLWVRETWSIHQLDGIVHKEFPNILYRADSSTRLLVDECVWKYVRSKFAWRPSIHMPRWASRLTLEMTGVRVERVQEISEGDCIAEGFNPIQEVRPGVTLIPDPRWSHDTAQAMFKRTWNDLNARRGYSWESNPWVWVVEFKTGEVT